MEKTNNETLEKIIGEIGMLYPEFPRRVICDFAHVLKGNIKHISETREHRGDDPFDHQEKMIGFGTGFDWLHLVNFALLVNPVAIDPEHPLVTSGKVLLGNLEAGRIDKEQGIVVMVSASYRDSIQEKRHAKIKARDLAEYAFETLHEHVPKLFDGYQIKFLVGTMDVNTRLFEPLENGGEHPFLFPKIPMEYFEKNSIVEFIVDHNKKKSEEFTNPYQADLRKVYRGEYPTEIMALKCMDGRMNLPLITGVPMGIIQPMRNIGAKFSIGWKALFSEVRAWKEYSMSQPGRRCLLLTTYHYSDADKHLGCAGHDYDTDKARENAIQLANEIRYVFGQGENAFFNVAVIGVNTDDDSIVVHGRDGGILEMSKYVVKYEEELACN